MRALAPRSRLHGEHGASMALILALIAILGLCVGAIAVQGTAGMMAVQGVTNQRGDVYGAEGAVDGAINYIRGELSRGRGDTTSCPSSGVLPTIFTAPSDVGTVTVTCRSLAGSGAEIEGINYPENAILTTSGLPGYPDIDNQCGSSASNSPGICITGNSSGVITVDGSIKANASSTTDPSITVDQAKLNAGDDAVRAAGACSPAPPTSRIVGAPVACGSGVPRLDPGGLVNEDKPATHGWGAEVQSLPAQAPNPTCNTTTKIATMTPGSYFDRDDLIGGFSSGSTLCTVVWMQPGYYYFDFEFNKNNGVEDSDEDGGLWRIGHDDLSRAQGLNAPGRMVVGGTRTCNPSPGFCWSNSTTAAQVLAAFPTSGACDRSAVNGVQTVFAGDTTYDVKDYGKLELCPFPNSSKQQIAVYGRKTNQTLPSATMTFRPTSQAAPMTGSVQLFAPNLATINNAWNTGTVTGRNRSVTVTLNGFASATPLPVASTVSSVNLKIAHRETPNPSTSTLAISAFLDTPNGDCTISNIPKTGGAAMTTYQLTLNSASTPSLSSCEINSLSDLVNSSVRWTVTTPNSGSPSVVADLDGIEMDATYAPRGLRAKDPGSLIVWMYGPWDNKKPQIYIWGTVYAPTSRIFLQTAGVNTTVARFGRGVVLANLQVDDLDVDQPFVAFANADGVAHYGDRYFELIATIGGQRQLRAIVRLTDTDGDLQTPGRVVIIDGWNAVN